MTKSLTRKVEVGFNFALGSQPFGADIKCINKNIKNFGANQKCINTNVPNIVENAFSLQSIASLNFCIH